MKQYPSIQREIVTSQPIIAFDKLDGSNIRAEFSTKKGFHKFGSRKQMLGEDSSSILRYSIPLIIEKYTDVFNEIMKILGKNTRNITGFFEFWGPNSFAGTHEQTDIGKFDVVLFDLDVYKLGLLEPKMFLELTTASKAKTPNALFVGTATKTFVESVIESTLEGMTFEGVVCKGKPLKRGYLPLMFKIKSKAWLDKLLNEKADRFEELQ